MAGDAALWIPGTDHAGIATQNVVEKELRKEGKRRQDIGREKFLERVWAWKEKHGSRIIEQLKRLGCSCDWRRERFTMDPGLSRAVAEVFVRLYEKGLVYRGERLVNWCPRCATALSDEESIPKETSGALWKIRYPLKAPEQGFVVVATTRPETMLGDTAVAVHPEDERYRRLIGKTAVLPLLGREIPIVADEAVEREFGTGALKITPAHDLADFEIGERHGLPRVNVLTPDGKINENGGPYCGLDRFEARKRVVADLEAQGLLEAKEKHVHSVPHCERCDTVLEYALSEQWFARMKPLAEPAIRAVEEGKIRFFPERWTSVYLHWMRNIRDWCISRQLWWGHRIPVWYCEEGHQTCAREAPAACATCGSGRLVQDPDVLDTWFSSWLWPFSTMGWPERTRTLERFYPTTVLVTGHEIIFFWVARMIMAGLEFMGEIPFRDVLIHGIVRDEQGRKMSKSLGNGIDPIEVIEETSADALRFTIFFLTPEGQDTRLSRARFEIGRNFCTKLWNAARLVIGNLGGFRADGGPLGARLPASAAPEDRWILSRLHETNAAVTRALAGHRVNAAVQALYDFTWGDFCDWWLEIAKPRLYGGAESGPEAAGGGAGGAAASERQAAQEVGAYVLERLLRLLHPFVPFVTEELWRCLHDAAGVARPCATIMLAPFPEAEAGAIDPRIEERFALLTGLVREIRNVRAQYNIPHAKTIQASVTGARGGDAAESLAIVRESADLVKRLARLETLEVSPGLRKPKGAALALAKDLEAYVPLAGLIDVGAERARVLARLEKVEQQLAGVRAKLAAPNFAERAPADVVERARETEAELARQAEALRASARDLEA